MIHNFPRLKAYSYARYSTPEQAQGDSLRRQTEAARRWACENGFELDETLSINDMGVSAFKGANREAGLGKFIAAIDLEVVPQGSVLIVENLDRLSRMPPRRAIRLLEDIVERGVGVLTLADGQLYTAERLDAEPMALMLALMIAWRANEESAMKGKRVAAAWAEKRRKMREGTAVRLTRRAPAWLRPEGHGWSIDEDKAATVRRIFSLTLEGVGEHGIAQKFNAEGVPVLGRGKHWHRSTISKTLRNRSVLGDLVPGRIEHVDGRRLRVLEDPIPNAFPAVIDLGTWSAVRALKDGNTSAVRGRGASKPLANILAGLARCPICGSTMTRVSKGRNGGPAKLVCSRAKVGGGCEYHGVPLEPVEDAITRKLAWIEETRPAGAAAPELDKEARRLQSTIDGADDHLAALADALARAPSAAGARRLAALEAEIQTMRSELAALNERRRLVDGGMVAARVGVLISATQDYTEGGRLEPVNAALRTLFDGAIVDYKTGRLLLNWKQGGTTSLVYDYQWPHTRPPRGLKEATYRPTPQGQGAGNYELTL